MIESLVFLGIYLATITVAIGIRLISRALERRRRRRELDRRMAAMTDELDRLQLAIGLAVLPAFTRFISAMTLLAQRLAPSAELTTSPGNGVVGSAVVAKAIAISADEDSAEKYAAPASGTVGPPDYRTHHEFPAMTRRPRSARESAEGAPE